jgi:hypothetical protein
MSSFEIHTMFGLAAGGGAARWVCGARRADGPGAAAAISAMGRSIATDPDPIRVIRDIRVIRVIRVTRVIRVIRVTRVIRVIASSA